MRAVGVLFCALPLMLAAAPPSPYVEDKARTLKALSADDIAALRAGRGMGLSKSAELNRHPGPRHVLDLADALKLSAAQRAQIQTTYDRMHADAIMLGERIVAQELALDKLFNAPPAPAETVKQVTTQLARLNGALRFTHLNAHIDTTRVLTPAQIGAYERLRGYAAADDTPAHHGLHAH